MSTEQTNLLMLGAKPLASNSSLITAPDMREPDMRFTPRNRGVGPPPRPVSQLANSATQRGASFAPRCSERLAPRSAGRATTNGRCSESITPHL
jgi:hypothetical protein